MNTLNNMKMGLVVVVALLAACSRPGTTEHLSFDTPEAAADAFQAALLAGDNVAIAKILGPDSYGVVDSGDAVQDKSDRDHFVELYKDSHSLEAAGDETRTLIVGPNNWPMPVPIVRKNGRWQLDGAAGVDEMILRRIGANELGAIAVMRGFVEAQQEYAAVGHDGDPAGIYAMKLVSDEGRENGLYWATEEGEEPSPAGEFVADAASEGYKRGAGLPYHGYVYRMLYAQSAGAATGAREYFKNGVLTEGFALVASPFDYGVTGIMTFIVNQDGAVYQKDLGDDTEAAAAALNSFDPDGWVLVN